MRIVVLATGDAAANPRIAALAASLRSVGHEVTIVCGGSPSSEPGPTRVSTRIPVGGGALGSLLRRAQPESLRRALFERRLAAAAIDLEPELVYATTEAVIPIAAAVAAATGAVVVRDPRHPDAGGVDIVRRAPGEVGLSESPAGPGLVFHTGSDPRVAWSPQPGRHSGHRIVVGYRSTPTTPARYLHAALERAGIEVEHVGGRLDWATVAPGTDAVVFVESPLPALEITGTNPGVPVLFWAHHGEHHTDAQLRLIARYGVDAGLLAHSWHLAHRYPVPVHRFPFAVAPELVEGSAPWAERRYDVAFVGSVAGGAPYGVRRQIIEALSSALPAERFALADGVPPDQMAALYRDARIVVNEGGTRHHPITMRVFEAIGSGAGLLTEYSPGLDLLFTPQEHFRRLRPEAVVEDVAAMLSDPATSDMADAAHRHALERHTYDHRVDELLAIASGTKLADAWTPEKPSSDLAEALAGDVDVSSVAAHGLPDLARQLPLHAVWTDPEPGTRSYDAVAFGSEWHGPVEAARDDAVRFIYIEPGTPMPPELLPFPTDTELTRVDLKAPGYRVDPEDAP